MEVDGALGFEELGACFFGGEWGADMVAVVSITYGLVGA